MAKVGLAERMEAVASRRGWAWPAASTVIALIGITGLAIMHRQVDLGTYLLGGAHAFSADLFTVTYPSDHLGFTYPPFAALLFSPFAHLPVRASEVAFSWLNLAALCTLLAVCLRAVCATLARRTVLWWALMLLVPAVMLDPVRQTFLLGQVNIFLALMVVADMTLDLPIPKGILVGLAAAVKVTPIILIPYFFLTRQTKAGMRAVAAFVGAALIAAAASPHDSWAYWTHYIRDPRRAGILSWIGNQGLMGAIERMLGRTVSNQSSFLLVVTVGAFGLTVAALAYKRSSPVLGFLIVEATEALANPVSWSHHFIWVVLFIAWLALGVDRPRRGEWWAIGVVVLFWAAPTWWSPHGPGVLYAGRGWLIPLSDAYPLLFIGFVVAMAVRVTRSAAHRVVEEPAPVLHSRA
ncbi:MAG TPA: glycosyltransferase 87 family protein [Acidimicrobiales bacterium]|nr:glycosyltransferase 87 family protein [Acidimicrobiales bacterium]